MKFIDEKTLQLDKELTELDTFVLDFVKILEKHTHYVIISGYVSILLGRSRATEDIDIFIPVINLQSFTAFYEDLKKHGYWCLNAESEIYQYLREGLAVRFALMGQIIPNFELKFALKPLSRASFDDTITVITNHGSLIISSLERQIAFKRYYLKSDKDMEDAAHIEKIFKDRIDLHKIKRYKQLIEHELS